MHTGVCTDTHRRASLYTCTHGRVCVRMYMPVYTWTHVCECIHAQIMPSNILLPDLCTVFCSSSRGDTSGSLLGTGTASVTDTNHVGLTIRLGCAWGLHLCGDGSQSELSPRNPGVQTPTVSSQDGRTGWSSPDASGPC